MTSGLRDAKRAAVARRLARITFEQVRDRGLGEVTVEDIVAEAEVSRRTFSNYYPCKEAAVAAVVVQSVETALAEWDPPEAVDVLDLARHLVEHQLRTGALRLLTEVATLAAEHPQLLPYVREAQWQVWSAVGDKILEAVPAPDGDDVETVRLVVGALFGIVSSGLSSTALRDGDAARQLHGSVQRGLARLEGGLGRRG
ncbi:MAG: TetR/AcrR family transcriptional regulator [Actinomycetota bacterium]